MIGLALSFVLPAVLSHFGVSLGVPALASLFAAKSGAGAVADKLVTSGVGKLLEKIAAGHPVTDQEREWLRQHPDFQTLKQSGRDPPGPVEFRT